VLGKVSRVEEFLPLVVNSANELGRTLLDWLAQASPHYIIVS
jgi:hypothetical protein